MAVGLSVPENLCPVKGVRLAACHCGIKQDPGRDDLVLIELHEKTTVAAVFTRNKFCAAPVTVAKDHLQKQLFTRYLLINSGNANAGTGESGMSNALESCRVLASAATVPPQAILPFSTGVIGEQLPVDRIKMAIPALIDDLNDDHWLAAAKGIMTTDTVPKAVSRQLNVNGQKITITGICKGSGMIKPDMATMLAYVATDALIEEKILNDLLGQAVEQSFNSITVDGDTSTNDACVLMATGASQVSINHAHEEFIQALNDVFRLLAQSIIRDGEGATKFVEIDVQRAGTRQDAKTLAYTIAHSPLVKTALFASDANWGRILAAIGRAPIANLDIERVDLFLGDVCLIKNGLPDESYSEQKGQTEMKRQEIVIRVDLNAGKESARIWTSDLSFDYVKINAEYRT